MLQNSVFWGAIGIILLIAEPFIPGVYALWIGIAALTTGVVALLFPALGVWLLLVFAVCTVASALIGNRIYARLNTTPNQLNDMQQTLIGQHGTCIAVADNNVVRIRVNGIEWAATANDVIGIHDIVEIVAFQDARPVVRRI